jgi:hypothetical protein
MSKLLDIIINEKLSSVEFVMDYIQLHFDGITLTFYVFPEIDIAGQSYNIQNHDYRNKICDLIDKKVKSIKFKEDESFDILFENSWTIHLSLKRDASNSQLPELLYMSDTENNWLVLG